MILQVVFLAISVEYFPTIPWHCILLADFLLGNNLLFQSFKWKSFTDPYVQKYHAYLISKLPDLDPLPAVELPLEYATFETVERLSHGYTIPIIIRGALKNATALTTWTNKQWWIDNYGDESVLCKYG